MNNFQRIKECKNEYEMADMIGGYFCNNLYKMRKEDSIEFSSLPFLDWLRSDRNIFDEERGGQA